MDLLDLLDESSHSRSPGWPHVREQGTPPELCTSGHGVLTSRLSGFAQGDWETRALDRATGLMTEEMEDSLR